MKDKLKRGFASLKSSPVVLLFFVFLFGFMVLDMVWPKRETSELENRPLQQVPAFSWRALFNNEWTADYGDYVKDQFAFRDAWIDLKARGEYFLGKTENGGVIFAPDEDGTMMFTKFYSLGNNESSYLANAQAVATFAQRHQGKVTFLLAPSASVIYKDKLPAGVPLADEETYLDNIFAVTAPYARNLDLRELFREHADEYIYYRTDHHWTTQGAYLAYEEFCRQLDLVPFDTAAHTPVEVEEFYGTSYSKSRLWNTVPDTLTYYPLDNAMTVEVAGEAKGETEGMYNLSALDTRDKYSAFLWGNNGYSVIQGDGEGSVLVVKDSYGNCFAPFLTANYAQVGVVDLRYWSGNIEQLAEEYDQILILYNFQSFYKDVGIRKLNINLNQ